MSSSRTASPAGSLEWHDEATVVVDAAPDRLFAYLDDHARLAAHMERRSMMMMGGRMTYEFDEDQGRAVGSLIRMRGRLLGIGLFVEEIVTERRPPTRKVWETRGKQALLIMDGYRMGFEISPRGSGSSLRVFLDYRLSESPFPRLAGLLFAKAYSKWCIRRMADDALRRFGETPGESA